MAEDTTPTFVTKRVLVEQEIDVTIDVSKFTPQFLSSFDEAFHNFGGDIDEHFKHLAQLYARGVTQGYRNDFVEGYGELGEMNIKFLARGCDEEIIEIPTGQWA